MKPNGQPPTQKKVFFTEDGREVPIKAISVMELTMAEEGIRAEYKERGEPIDPPTYEAITAGGGKIKNPLTADNLIVEDNQEETERRQREWIKHITAHNQMMGEIGRVKTSLIMEGVDVMPESDDWLARKKRLHIKVPDDPDERIMFYKMTEVIKTPGDLASVQLEILVLSSSGAVDRKAVDAARASFLGSLQNIAKRPTGEVETADGDSGETTAGTLGS